MPISTIALNFFETQDRVRKNSFQLVILFLLAVVTLIVMTNLLFLVVLGYSDSGQIQSGENLLQRIDWQTFATVSAGVVVVVLFGSLYKIMTLSAGGKTVAESLGGQLIPRNTSDPDRRKLLNVVEEMAIASGTPAPPVYVLADEHGINAFAAGFSPRDAVIGVTQGAIDHLSREQLQGVIAHEFSHIFNGDMRLNIRLIGILNGILIIGLAGYYLLYSASYSRRGRGGDKGAGAILALALGLMVIGFAGTFFGGLIKAAVSRQREYLADASAVQFTRNPDGIAGALKRIGGLETGSRVENPGATEVSHAFFAQGVSGFIQSLSATHPPLSKRILRIDPHWDGQYYKSGQPGSTRDVEEPAKKESMTRDELARKVAAIATGVTIADVAHAIDQAGSPEQEAIDYARALIEALPVVLKEAAREPYGARAIIYSLVLDPGSKIRGWQFDYLQAHADPNVFDLTEKFTAPMDGLDIRFRLPLIDIGIPALKQLSPSQYQVFRDNLVALIEIDSRVDFFEWSLQKILFSHLDDQFFKPTPAIGSYSHAKQLKPEIELLLSTMVYAGHRQQGNIQAAFDAAAASANTPGLQLLARNEISLSNLDRALQKIETLKLPARRVLLIACAASVVNDQIILPGEIELLRAFADALGCPMPPIVPSKGLRSEQDLKLKPAGMENGRQE